MIQIRPSLSCSAALPVCFAAAVFLFGASAGAQTLATVDLPDAPQAQKAAQSSASQAQPDSVTPQSTTPESPEERHKKAHDQLRQEETQRILGVMPSFNVVNDRNAPPLTVKQKFDLDLHSSLDPFAFLLAGLDAGEEQAQDDFPEYGQGAAGYAKRFGASYADSFDGNLWGNAILPSLLHEDPRYFRMGSGSFIHRAFHAASAAVWCRRDDGSWGPNYGNVAGNFIGGGISNLYYPASDRGAGLTAERALTVTAEGAIGSELVEFWPDISRRIFRKRSQMRIGGSRTTETN